MAANKSRTRGTSAPPNRRYEHRPSSCMAGRRPSHFFKIILPSTIDDKKLKIPEKFVSEFGDELSDDATLTVPNGHIWQVGLEKGNKKIWFHDGWQDFMEYHSVHYGYFLVFRYEGNSKFHVLVFDNTATEIEYPRSKDCELEDDAKKSRHDKLKENEMSDEVRRGTYVRGSFSGTSSKGRRMMSSRRERAIQAAKKLKPKNPSFMAILKGSHIRGGRPGRSSLYVPSGFSKKYLIGHQFVELQTCDGKHWDARCTHNGLSRSSRNIGKGWMEFRRDNNLEEDDVCVFELINRNPVVLNVSMFHVADY